MGLTRSHSAASRPAYFDEYENLAFSRDEDGVLVLRFHTDGGPLCSPVGPIEIARGLAAKPALYRTLQKQTLNLNLRRRITQDVPFGMALEGLTAADLPYQNSA